LTHRKSLHRRKTSKNTKKKIATFHNNGKINLLSLKEIERMIAAAKTVRDKALISTLYESGCRISQLSALKLDHIKQCSDGFVLTVSRMGRSRRLLLTVSAPCLSLWLNEHPGVAIVMLHCGAPKVSEPLF